MASDTGLRDAESIIFNRGCSFASWTFTGRVCHPGQRPGLRDAESIIFNRGCSFASWTFTGRVCHPGQRPVERAPA